MRSVVGILFMEIGLDW